MPYLAMDDTNNTLIELLYKPGNIMKNHLKLILMYLEKNSPNIKHNDNKKVQKPWNP